MTPSDNRPEPAPTTLASRAAALLEASDTADFVNAVFSEHNALIADMLAEIDHANYAAGVFEKRAIAAESRGGELEAKLTRIRELATPADAGDFLDDGDALELFDSIREECNAALAAKGAPANAE
jgi:hypothetical protein